jgi:hypothetical protein
VRGPDVDVPDAELAQVPVKLRLELGPVVGLHDVDAKRQPPDDFVGELDGRRLVAPVVDLEHPDARAVVEWP